MKRNESVKLNRETKNHKEGEPPSIAVRLGKPQVQVNKCQIQFNKKRVALWYFMLLTNSLEIKVFRKYFGESIAPSQIMESYDFLSLMFYIAGSTSS